MRRLKTAVDGGRSIPKESEESNLIYEIDFRSNPREVIQVLRVLIVTVILVEVACSSASATGRGSPLYEARLQASLADWDRNAMPRAGLVPLAKDSTGVQAVSLFMPPQSQCLGSACVGSTCLGSGCPATVCLGSFCFTSLCILSGCHIESTCIRTCPEGPYCPAEPTGTSFGALSAVCLDQ